MSLVYGKTRHTISIAVIRVAMNIHCDYTTEQYLRGSQPLMNWVNESVPSGEMHDGYVKLRSLGKNQLLFQAWLKDNIIFSDKQLNKRQVEYLHMIQKQLEIKVDDNHVRATDFAFSICEVLRGFT